MNFKESNPIYIQIAERLADEVLAGTYPPEGRVPGVREYSALLEVNVNTTVKAYEYLSRHGIIQSRRGLGYYVTSQAPKLIADVRRQNFRAHTLPEFIRQLHQLDIPFEEVQAAWRDSGA